jgi:hypothetical protein
MAGPLDERTAGRLERVAPRAHKLFSAIAGRNEEGMAEAAGGHESTEARGGPNHLDVRAIARQIRRNAATPTATLAGRNLDVEADAIAAQLVARAREVLSQLQRGAPDSAISGEDAVALEAVLRTRGRPALNVEGDRIEAIDPQKHPGSDFWRRFLDDHETTLVKVASAAGAVIVKDRVGALPPWVQGTAWLVKPDLVVTNRHVLFPPIGGMRLARRVPGAVTQAKFKSDLEITIDFAFDDRQNPRPISCAVLNVVYVSQDSDPIDVALIKIGPPGGAAQQLASPLSIATKDEDYSYLYIVGHPGKMPKVPEEVLAVFGTPNEKKRVSFGETMDPEQPLPDQIVHDASTIGGFSGGCVLAFLKSDVVGLHYWGDPLKGNRAFTAAALRAHEFAKLL